MWGSPAHQQGTAGAVRKVWGAVSKAWSWCISAEKNKGGWGSEKAMLDSQDAKLKQKYANSKAQN